MSINSYHYFVDDYDSPQAAINACNNRGGGVVEFGPRTDYDANGLRVEFDSRHNIVALRGQGFGHRHDSSPTVLNVPAGAVGIEFVHSSTDAAKFCADNFEVHGGDVGMHLVNNPTNWSKGNDFSRIMLRECARVGMWVQEQSFHGVWAQIVVIAPQNPSGQSIGIETENHQNASKWLDCEVRQTNIGGFVINTNADGSGFNSTVDNLLAEANYGPGLRARNTKPFVQGDMATQVNGMALLSCYFEADGMTTGEADLLFEGHLHDSILHMIRCGPPSQAQRDNPAGPLMLDVRGVARKVDIMGFTGGKAINVAGQRVLGMNHSSVLRLSFHDDVRSVGRQITRNDQTLHYQRISVSDAGLMTLDDVNAAMLS